MDKPKLKVQGFYGIVILKDWIPWVDSKSYKGFFGEISIYEDKELVGFRVRGNESNWMLRVKGSSASINILGCQIRGVIETGKAPAVDSCYKVIP